ncbi:hypothetical protein KMW28_15980 [Flammeovirga yaeyamensis]|uniref:Uncharacterized protein n=1 Tax=Flammeovirga yaeyamensis TaxID=367791 RepID=A0AAX1N0W3_9BACT|nr:hypothetical protein [Flammeovirga yaeyamensis]MBB3698492.1 hypothetical protein [Flammeovirga yaeyamensis]NMF34159.1 hypothetical protein [Flammeovirga yaeyamensis]QWG01144.1 hypothetical protein KMW28_15980 [Flammeovirga yaeyamensis]
MDIIKTSTDWAKAEVFSSSFFMLSGGLFLLASVAFWYLGKTEMAKAYVTPSIVVGVLLFIIGAGIFYANKTRTTSFVEDYNKDAAAFVQSEIVRIDKSMGEYKTAVFRVIPVIIAVASMLIIFMDKPVWRASSITVIGMMFVIMMIDSNANQRLVTYKEKLLEVANQNK